jgi:hypothetical protein
MVDVTLLCYMNSLIVTFVRVNVILHCTLLTLTRKMYHSYGRRNINLLHQLQECNIRTF